MNRSINHNLCCANDNGFGCLFSSRLMAGIDSCFVLSFSRSIHPASPVTVGFSNRTRRGISTENALRMRAINCMATSECPPRSRRSEEHTSELQSRPHLVCRLLLEKKKKIEHALRRLHDDKPTTS